MGLWDKIFGGAGVLDGVNKIIGKFKLDPEVKAKLEAELRANELEFKKLELELESKIADYQAREIEAAVGVLKTEAGSDDRFTRRWRPAFGYMCTVLLFWNYAIVPVFKQTPVALPDALFQLFAAYLLMAVGSRSWEKITSIKQKGGSRE